MILQARVDSMNNTSTFPAIVGQQIMTSKNNRNCNAFVKENHDAIAECRKQLFDYCPEKDYEGGISMKESSGGVYFQHDTCRRQELCAEQQQQKQPQPSDDQQHPDKDCGDIPMKKTSRLKKNINQRDHCGESENKKDKQTPSSSKPSVETAATVVAEPELSFSKSKPSQQEPNEDGSNQKSKQPSSENRTSNASPCHGTDAPSDECSSPLQKEAENRRVLFPNKTHPIRSRTNTEEEVVHEDDNNVRVGSFYDCFAICCDLDDMSSVFSEITLDAIFGKCTPSPPVLPIAPLEAGEKIEQGNVWAIELLDGKHQKGDTLWFRLSGHGDADKVMHYKDLEGIEVLDYVHAVTKVQESAMFYVLKDNGEGMWVESDWVKDAMVDILMQSKRDETISIPTLRSLRKKKKKDKKRWFPWPRSLRSL